MRGARSVLALVVALQLVAETALTPYWPRLLRALFGTEDLAATGTYLTICRVAGLLALPLWGLAARRWPLENLLVAGLLGSAVFDLGLALAPSLPLFTVLSAGVVATGCSLVLAYPALVAVADSGGGDRLSGVLAYAAVFHAAAVVSTVVGAGVVALPQPRFGLAAFAVLDVLLAVAVRRAVAGGSPAAAPDGVRGRRPAAAPLVAVVAVALLVEVGLAVPRPFFTELVLQGGGSLTAAAVLFLLPALAALATLPAARPLARRFGRGLLPASGLLAAGGLALQALGAMPGPAAVAALTAGRVMFGVGTGLLVVAVDLRVFRAVGTAGPGFAAVETARSGALLAAPVLATAAAAVALPAPLVVAAVLIGAAAVLAPLTSPAIATATAVPLAHGSSVGPPPPTAVPEVRREPAR